MLRPVAVLLTLVLIATGGSGCASRQGRSAGLVVAGAVVAAVGVAVLTSSPPSESSPTEEKIECLLGGCVANILAGAGLIAVGGALAIGGLVTMPGDDEREPAPAIAADDDPMRAMVIAAVRAPTLPVPTLALAPPEPRARARPLPEIATDALTMQLAKQARGAAVRTDCATASVVLAQIEARDRTYHAALVANGVVAPCR